VVCKCATFTMSLDAASGMTVLRCSNLK
jgi:hypothetical protein